jgi:hypothetical protein
MALNALVQSRIPNRDRSDAAMGLTASVASFASGDRIIVMGRTFPSLGNDSRMADLAGSATHGLGWRTRTTGGRYAAAARAVAAAPPEQRRAGQRRQEQRKFLLSVLHVFYLLCEGKLGWCCSENRVV